MTQLSDIIFMKRALDLARRGIGAVSPNPMVGAVIVGPNGRILGEGWHRCFGGPHAEVNACESVGVQDRKLLKESTIYVTLEPCSHYGKTPPCADLLVSTGFRRVVIACVDPFAKVSGRGIERLRDAGIEVRTGILEKEAKELNKTFFFAHKYSQPYITLKWAQSADGFMDSLNIHPYRFSNPLTTALVHKIRSENDAIITSTATMIADNPRLDTREWTSVNHPLKVVLGKTQIPFDGLIYTGRDINETLSDLYNKHNVTSVLIEAGPKLLQAFLDSNLWNEARVEINPVILGNEGIKRAPVINYQPSTATKIEKNTIFCYRNYSKF